MIHTQGKSIELIITYRLKHIQHLISSIPDLDLLKQNKTQKCKYFKTLSLNRLHNDFFFFKFIVLFEFILEAFF